MKNRRHRFTLIEMLIVITVIAILACIVSPRLIAAGQKAKEAELRGDLHKLRNAIQQFEANCGDYPSKLEDLTLTELDGGTKGGRGIVLDPKGWAENAPFLESLPRDPFTGEAGWDYDPETGEVHSGSKLTAINGELYSIW